MTAPRVRLTVAFVCVLAGAAACRRGGGGGGTAASGVSPDSLGGTVALTGTIADQRLVLRAGARTANLATSSADSASLSRLGGVEVMVRGRAEASAFRVVSFVAQRVDGAPVADGVLRRDGERLVLETAAGRIALGNPPAALRGMIGARVWMGGPLGTGPNVFGVITPAP